MNNMSYCFMLFGQIEMFYFYNGSVKQNIFNMANTHTCYKSNFHNKIEMSQSTDLCKSLLRAGCVEFELLFPLFAFLPVGLPFSGRP